MTTRHAIQVSYSRRDVHENVVYKLSQVFYDIDVTT